MERVEKEAIKGLMGELIKIPAGGIWNILTSREFCRGKKRIDKELIQRQIEDFVVEGKPLKFLGLFGGYKNPNVVQSPYPDLSEIRTLERIAMIIEKITQRYSPGGEIILVTTGKKGELANCISFERVQIYEDKIKEIVKEKSLPIEIITWGELFEKHKRIQGLSEVKEEIKKIREEFDKFIKGNLAREKDGLFWQKQMQRAKRHAQPSMSKEIEEMALNYAIFEIIEERFLREEFNEEVIRISFRPKIEHNAISLYACKKGVIRQPWNNTCTKCEFHRDCHS